MKHTTKKKSFFSDLAFTKNTYGYLFSPVSKLLFVLFLLSSLSVFVHAKTTLFEVNFQQVPVKPTAKPVVKVKIKGKTKSKKPKKGTVSKKDSLSDIDPANTSSPLFQNNQ
ncbi:MAG: hypothetical protein V4585_03595 [Bacteroidota bacterium]